MKRGRGGGGETRNDKRHREMHRGEERTEDQKMGGSVLIQYLPNTAASSGPPGTPCPTTRELRAILCGGFSNGGLVNTASQPRDSRTLFSETKGENGGMTMRRGWDL